MLTGIDLAKYPFTVEAAEYVGKLGFKIEEFSDPEYVNVVERAVKRIQETVTGRIKDLRQTEDLRKSVEVELLSYPIATIMMRSIGDAYFQKRFALYEAKKASSWLETENLEKVIEIAQKTFSWNISKAKIDSAGWVKLGFIDYLRNASKLREDKWKLVNRNLEYGDVYVTKAEAARLLEEEIRQHILTRIEKPSDLELPATLLETMEELKAFLQKQKRALPVEESLGEVDSRAFPPCIANIYSEISSGRNVSHIGRFTLTAFLINIGASIEDVSRLYTSATDFDERMTKYQVEHIAGEAGGKVKYKPLSCDNMRTHRLCHNPDENCSKVNHPLQYYRRKKRISLGI